MLVNMVEGSETYVSVLTEVARRVSARVVLVARIQGYNIIPYQMRVQLATRCLLEIVQAEGMHEDMLTPTEILSLGYVGMSTYNSGNLLGFKMTINRLVQHAIDRGPESLDDLEIYLIGYALYRASSSKWVVDVSAELRNISLGMEVKTCDEWGVWVVERPELVDLEVMW